jgi:hypothetical protein
MAFTIRVISIDDQHRVEHGEAKDGQQHGAGAEAGDRGRRGQHAFDDPGLAPELGDDPSRTRWRSTAAGWKDGDAQQPG